MSPQFSTSATAQLFIRDLIFKVHDKGTRKFKYIISNNSFRIHLSDRSAFSKLPFAMVQISSGFLSHNTPQDAVAKIFAVLSVLGDIVGDVKVSRADLFCDILTDYDISKIAEHEYITRAGNVARHSIKGQFSGCTFGLGGQIAFRLYDKTMEILKSQKFYLCDVWAAAGWKKGEIVWRFEFQVERSALVKFGASTFDKLSYRKSHIWNYLTQKWIRIIVNPDNESRRERCETHPLWLFLQNLSLHSYLPTLILQPATTYEQRKAIIARYYKIALTDQMACTNEDDPEEAHAELLVLLKSFYVKKDSDPFFKDFSADINQAVARKRRDFGTGLNSTSALTPPEVEDENP